MAPGKLRRFLQSLRPKRALNFVNKSGAVRLRIPTVAIETINRLCTGSGDLETGGILIGHYVDSNNVAVVDEIVSAPLDSARTRSSFERGVEGLPDLLGRRWLNDQHYVGDWHSHPNSSPKASLTDLESLGRISNNPEMYCPNPVLLIMGSAGAIFVATKQDGELRLMRQKFPSTPR